MPSVRQIVIAVVAVMLLALVHTSTAADQHASSPVLQDEKQRFRELLNSVPATSLHKILHEYIVKRYQHGVFAADEVAMEAVHQEDPAAATKLVELAKRQAGGNNTSGEVPVSTSTEVIIVPSSATSSPNANPTTAQPPPTTSAVQDTPTPTPTPASTVVPVSSTLPAVTTTPVGNPGTTTQAPPPTSNVATTAVQSSTPVVIVTSTSVLQSAPAGGGGGGGSSVGGGSTNTGVQSSASQGGNTPVTTTSVVGGGGGGGGSPSQTTQFTTVVNPTSTIKSGSVVSSGSSVAGQVPSMTTTRSLRTQEIVYTTTLPNGARSTVTSYTVVGAGEVATTPGGDGGSPTLQTNAAVPPYAMGRVAGGVIAGVIGVAAAL